MAKKTKTKTKTAPRQAKPEKPYRPRLTRKDLSEIMDFSKGLARAAGTLALSFYGRANPSLRYDHDLITEADLAVQEYIRKEVHAAYPAHRFLGEEGAALPDDRDKQSPLWVVDPVDGSAGFSAGMPVWAISICLFDGTRPVLGLIYLPVTGELYHAIAGAKAMLNDRTIEVRDEVVDNESLLLTYSRFHSDFVTHFPGKVRSLGSTAAHLAYVARGAAGGAVLGNVHVWDVAAGSVLLEAAGGGFRDLNGKKVDLSCYLEGGHIDKVLLAAPRGLHADLTATLELR
ncbi:MAG: inositol monophosphatase [Deltaproteobacteria bacterium]|nr:inositol monophosphatase [Deltaproteobacteria bacterium]